MAAQIILTGYDFEAVVEKVVTIIGNAGNDFEAVRAEANDEIEAVVGTDIDEMISIYEQVLDETELVSVGRYIQQLLEA